jgi:hypothetical protein
MFIASPRVIYSILFYILSIILIIISKPSLVYDKNGDVKPFGVGPDKTIFPLGVCVVAFAILSYYVFCVIDLIFGAKKN